MQLLGKRVGQITAEDIQSLVARGIPESHTIEYKRDLPGSSDAERHEYLADVSALANTQGGVILYGISEKKDEEGKNTGIPDKIIGVAGSVDVVGQSLRNAAQDALNPSLPSLTIQAVDVDGKTVLIVGLPRSLFAPHAVWYKRSGKYYRRDSFGKRQVAPLELRQMFLEQYEWGEQADAFRRARVNKVLAGETGLSFPEQLPTFVHILPLGRLQTAIPIFAGDWQQTAMSAFPGKGSMKWMSNFDGFIVHENIADKGPVTFYAQAFRFGGFEFFTSRLWRASPPGLFLQAVQAFLDESTRRALPIMRNQWGVEPPYAVLLSICRTRNVVGIFQGASGYTETAGAPIQQEDLLLPPAILSVEDLEKPDRYAHVVEIAWQAAGHPRIEK